MAKFKFRLETVRKVRDRAREEAKRAYLEAIARRVQAEAERDEIQQRLAAIASFPARDLSDRFSQDAMILRLTDDVSSQETVISILVMEEEEAQKAYLQARQDAEAIERLREKRYAEWLAEEDRLENLALDEWATQRRWA
ncbi:MAG: flagellar FliJ family protein [Fimbriimonadaceae bacterium]